MNYHLFEVVGVELEYMLVQAKSLKINPIVDQLLIKKNGGLIADIDNGKIQWSNELVAHVLELKTNGPTSDLENLDIRFAENIKEINSLLEEFDSVLLPSASHPLMQPKTETQLWRHSHSKIYDLYNRIFDCSGHGWSNVQSMHINLPFFNDEEFGKLHAAVRILLPIIPGLSASSPMFEGKLTGFLDSRLEVYKSNQKEIPQMTGKVIPEQVFNKADYYKHIFEPINAAIKPFDTENVLDHHFLNSRGAIARFDRNAIEIRVIDIQECPAADIAIAVLIIESLKLLLSGELFPIEELEKWHENELFDIFNAVVRNAENTRIENPAYLEIFGIERKVNVKQIWEKLYQSVASRISSKHCETLEIIFTNGSLSSRIIKKLGGDLSQENIKKVYTQLAWCLANNEIFKG
ncbi:carboxylate-amine ligase [Salegentibacter sp. F14]